MKTKTSEYIPINKGEDSFRDGSSGSGSRHPLNNIDQELYKEEDDVALTMVRIKRISLPNKGENWKIFVDQKNVELIEGAKLSGKERDYLRSVDGIRFIMAYYKSGWRSLNNFRALLKDKLK